jgi:lipopolysaccharide transport system permease protein
MIAFSLLLALMGWYGVVPATSLLLAPIIFGCFVLVAAGVGTCLAALNVAYRDFRYVVPFLVQLWMFATPTIYMDANRGEAGPAGILLLVNPLSPLVAAFRAAVFGSPIDWNALAVAACASVALFFMGCLYFRRVEDGFSDII